MNVFTLKLIALLCMVIDHIGYFFITNQSYLSFRIIGRIAAPIFLFLFVESYFLTSNKKNFQKRLFTNSIIMFIGNLILSLFLNNMYPLNTNIFFTMFICSLLLDNIEKLNYKSCKFWLINIIYIVIFNFVEYNYLALICVLVFYFSKKINNKLVLIISYISSTTIYCLFTSNYIQLFMVSAIFFILFYNGNLGYKGKFIKYFYYNFYILHLWIFAIINNVI